MNKKNIIFFPFLLVCHSASFGAGIESKAPAATSASSVPAAPSSAAEGKTTSILAIMAQAVSEVRQESLMERSAREIAGSVTPVDQKKKPEIELKDLRGAMLGRMLEGAAIDRIENMVTNSDFVSAAVVLDMENLETLLDGMRKELVRWGDGKVKIAHKPKALSKEKVENEAEASAEIKMLLDDAAAIEPAFVTRARILYPNIKFNVTTRHLILSAIKQDLKTIGGIREFVAKGLDKVSDEKVSHDKVLRYLGPRLNDIRNLEQILAKMEESNPIQSVVLGTQLLSLTYTFLKHWFDLLGGLLNGEIKLSDRFKLAMGSYTSTNLEQVVWGDANTEYRFSKSKKKKAKKKKRSVFSSEEREADAVRHSLAVQGTEVIGAEAVVGADMVAGAGAGVGAGAGAGAGAVPGAGAVQKRRKTIRQRILEQEARRRTEGREALFDGGDDKKESKAEAELGAASSSDESDMEHDESDTENDEALADGELVEKGRVPKKEKPARKSAFRRRFGDGQVERAAVAPAAPRHGAPEALPRTGRIDAKVYLYEKHAETFRKLSDSSYREEIPALDVINLFLGFYDLNSVAQAGRSPFVLRVADLTKPEAYSLTGPKLRDFIDLRSPRISLSVTNWQNKTFTYFLRLYGAGGNRMGKISASERKWYFSFYKKMGITPENVIKVNNRFKGELQVVR
jgi:hypothetical protein